MSAPSSENEVRVVCENCGGTGDDGQDATQPNRCQWCAGDGWNSAKLYEGELSRLTSRSEVEAAALEEGVAAAELRAAILADDAFVNAVIDSDASREEQLRQVQYRATHETLKAARSRHENAVREHDAALKDARAKEESP